MKVEKQQASKKLSSRSFLSFLKVLFPPHTGSFSAVFRFSCFMVHGYLHRTVFPTIPSNKQGSRRCWLIQIYTDSAETSDTALFCKYKLL